MIGIIMKKLKSAEVLDQEIFEETIEQFEIRNSIEIRLKNYDPQNNILWENIKEDEAYENTNDLS